jgi:hypothetical protein
MAKSSRSIGLDDAGGRPRDTPDGPYTTDRADDSRRRRRPAADGQASLGEGPPQRHRPRDLASRRKGPAQP